jgi:hypothetical protein
MNSEVALIRTNDDVDNSIKIRAALCQKNEGEEGENLITLAEHRTLDKRDFHDSR